MNCWALISDGKLPHPQGLDVRVTPSAAEGVIGRTVEGNHVGPLWDDDNETLCSQHFLLTWRACWLPGGEGSSHSPRMSAMSFPPAAAGRDVQVKVGGQFLATSPTPSFPAPGFKAAVIELHPAAHPADRSTNCADSRRNLQDKRAAAQGQERQPTRRGAAAPRLDRRGHEDDGRNPQKTRPVPKKIGQSGDGGNRHAQVTIAPDAEPGERELRLGTPTALSKPLVFCVGQLPEFNKPEPPSCHANHWPRTGRETPMPRKPPRPSNRASSLPCVVNGQITARRRGPLPLPGPQGAAAGHRRRGAAN